MRIFVTGGTGFIGSHFLRAAMAAGDEVRALRRSNGSQPRIPLDPEPEWITKGMADVSVEDFLGTDALVHLAAAGVSPQKADPETLLRVNVTESHGLWLRAAETGIRRFVICGSSFEYGRSAERFDFIPADAPLEPVCAYGASKAAASMVAIALAVEKQIELIVLRPFQVFGDGQHKSNFWPSLKAAALCGGDFLMTPGDQWRDFVPVEEVARAFVRAVRRADLRPGAPRVENIGTGVPQTLRTFGEHWWRQWGARGKLVVGARPHRAGEVMRCVPAHGEGKAINDQSTE